MFPLSTDSPCWFLVVKTVSMVRQIILFVPQMYKNHRKGNTANSIQFKSFGVNTAPFLL